MVVASIAYFFAVTILLGFVVDLFVTSWRANAFERIVMRLGVGLALFSVLGVVFNLLGIPLDWRVFLAAGIVTAAGAVVRKKGFSGLFGSRGVSWSRKGLVHLLAVLCMFGLTSTMYISGSFRYPWFEDGDPWGYALSSKYIAEKKTFSAGSRPGHYFAPYTQGYQIFMGVLHQTNRSIYWNMKFFNALVLSLSILFFYFFAGRFTSDEELALCSTFFLFAVPAWVSHFVFSLGYNMTLFVVALYVFAMISRDEEGTGRQWQYPGMIVVGSLWVNHFYTAFMGTFLLMVFYANKALIARALNVNILLAAGFGFLLSMLFYVPAYLPHWDSLARLSDLGGAEVLAGLVRRNWNLRGIGIGSLAVAALLSVYFLFRRREPPAHDQPARPTAVAVIYLAGFVLLMGILLMPWKIASFEGTGTRGYGVADFFVARFQNITNNPRGIGFVVMCLFCFGMGHAVFHFRRTFDHAHVWLSTTLLWSVLSVLIILGAYFSVSIAPFRMWTFFGPFASLLAGYGFVQILERLPGEGMKIAAWMVLAAAVIPTSFIQKYTLNTDIWPDHMVRVPESRSLYEQMRNGAVPRESRVLRLCGDSTFMVGYDMSMEPVLDRRANSYHGRALQETAEQNKRFLKEHDIEYVTLGLSCAAERRLSDKAPREYGQTLEDKKKELERDGGFQKTLETRAEVLFRVR